jgi:hypothetical protein
VLVQDQLLSCTAWWVIKRHLLTVRHQPLVSSPAAISNQTVETRNETT